MWLRDLHHFLLPPFCLVCGERHASQGSVLCLACEHGLPRNRFRDARLNPIAQVFWGRCPVELATSLFRFEKGSPYQRLLHELKYRGNRNAGIYLGKLLGHALKEGPFTCCDLLVPVPLHPLRLRKRGYNQSELIGRGMSMELGIPQEAGLLQRKGRPGTQTHLGRFDRYMKVQGDFCLARHAPELAKRHILLVDDVLTTGATLEACIQALHRAPCGLISVATACSA